MKTRQPTQSEFEHNARLGGTYTVVYRWRDDANGKWQDQASYIRPSEQGYIQLPTDREVWAHILATEFDETVQYQVLYVIPGAHNFLQFDN